MNILIGQLIQWTTTPAQPVDRVIAISTMSKSIVTIRVLNNGRRVKNFLIQEYSADEIFEAIDNSDAYLLENDPFLDRLVSEDELSKSALEKRDERWRAIQPIIEQIVGGILPDNLGALVAQRAKETQHSRTSIYSWILQFLQAGGVKNSLIPNYHHCGGPGKHKQAGMAKRGRPNKDGQRTGINVTELVRNQFKAVAELYKNGKFRTKKEAFQHLLEKHYKSGYTFEGEVAIPILKPSTECPSQNQFYDYLQSMYATGELERKRMGEKRNSLRNKVIRGNSTSEAYGPGSLYQVDSTPVDTILVSSLNPEKIIGRVQLYTIVDVFTHLIVGIMLTTEHASSAAFALAFENAVSDKVEFAQQVGITITNDDWPASGLPQAILADRGPEFTSDYSNIFSDFLGIRMSNTGSGLANMKGIVESLFNITNRLLFHKLPGAIPKRHERGDKNYRLDARLNIQELRQLLVRAVLLYNSTHFIKDYPKTEGMIRDRVVATPLELWEWGVQNRGGILRNIDTDALKFNLLPHQKASITAKGIQFNGTYYNSNAPQIANLVEKVAYTKKREPIEVFYNPHLPANVIYFRSDTGAFLPCYQQDPANEELFKGKDFWEIQDYKENESNDKQKMQELSRQNTAHFNAHLQAIVKHATKRTDAAIEASNLSKRGRQQNIHETTIAEREAERAERYTTTAFDSQENLNDNDVLAPVQNNSEALYIPPRNYLELLQKGQENKDEEIS
jgi:putative transposase